jgi:hypothetical protein
MMTQRKRFLESADVQGGAGTTNNTCSKCKIEKHRLVRRTGCQDNVHRRFGDRARRLRDEDTQGSKNCNYRIHRGAREDTNEVYGLP